MLRLVPIGPDGLVYVADTFNDRIQVFDADGEFVDSIASSGSAPGQVFSPFGIAFNSDGALFVTDTDNNRIQKFVHGKTIDTPHP